jgi:GT2 family glycosyltransferase
MSGNVMLGFIHGGWTRAEFLNSMLNAVCGPQCDPAIGGVISSSAGPLVALARNNLASQFLASDMEWLCSVDTDIVFATDAISRLLASADPEERPIMSGLYHVFENGKKIQAVYWNRGEQNELDVVPMELVYDDPAARVFAVGAGFLLVHRSVFEKIQKMSDGQPCWFRETVIDERDFGEDMSFCLRANVAGFPIHVNTGVRVGHIKSAMLGECMLWPIRSPA